MILFFIINDKPSAICSKVILTIYLWKKFTLISDHEPTGWIYSVKDPSQRLIRWRLKLRDHEYEFKYKPGTLNANANVLSRNLVIENSDKEVKEEKQLARLLPMITRQVNKIEGNSSKLALKTSETESKRIPTIQTRKGFTSRIEPSKPSTSKTQKPTLSRSKSNASTSAKLDRSTISKRLIRRRVETQRAQSRPDYTEDSSLEETEKDQEPTPILRKRVLPSANLPPAVYPPLTISKSAPVNAPEGSTELFPEDQEESTPITGKQETGPMKSETEFTDRANSAIKIVQDLLKETQEKGKVRNSKNKENLDPGISSSDEEVPTSNLHTQTRKSDTFDSEIALTPGALEKYTPLALRKHKAISMPFPEKLDDDPGPNQ